MPEGGDQLPTRTRGLTFPPPDEPLKDWDDAYAPLRPTRRVWAQGDGGDFRRPYVGTFTWPRAWMELQALHRHGWTVSEFGPKADGGVQDSTDGIALNIGPMRSIQLSREACTQ